MFGTTSLASAFTFSCMTLMIGTRSFGDVNWEQALLESLVDFIGVVLRLRYWSEFFKEISSTTSKRNIRKLLDLLKLLENPTNLLTCPTEKLFVLLKDVSACEANRYPKFNEQLAEKRREDNYYNKIFMMLAIAESEQFEWILSVPWLLLLSKEPFSTSNLKICSSHKHQSLILHLPPLDS